MKGDQRTTELHRFNGRSESVLYVMNLGWRLEGSHRRTVWWPWNTLELGKFIFLCLVHLVKFPFSSQQDYSVSDDSQTKNHQYTMNGLLIYFVFIAFQDCTNLYVRIFKCVTSAVSLNKYMEEFTFKSIMFTLSRFSKWSYCCFETKSNIWKEKNLLYWKCGFK